MLTSEQVANLQSMANSLLAGWDNSDNRQDEALCAQAYAQVCQLLSQQESPFLQIGKHIIRKVDIIRVEIKELNSYYNEPKHVRLYTRDVYGGESYGSTTNYEKFPYDSPEAQMLLAYFADRSELLDPRSE